MTTDSPHTSVQGPGGVEPRRDRSDVYQNRGTTDNTFLFLQKGPETTSVCRELVQINRETLVNVRKHSQARNVLVRFGADNGAWTLVIDDDGKGFPFSGSWSQEDLDRDRPGPAVMRERLRAIS